MSISADDITAFDRPKQGIIRAGVEAELRLCAFRTFLDIPVPPESPEERRTYVRRIVVNRLYGDIAQDFEAFLRAAFGGAEPGGDALALREKIREKLRGDGPGERRHKAP